MEYKVTLEDHRATSEVKWEIYDLAAVWGDTNEWGYLYKVAGGWCDWADHTSRAYPSMVHALHRAIYNIVNCNENVTKGSVFRFTWYGVEYAIPGGTPWPDLWRVEADRVVLVH